MTLKDIAEKAGVSMMTVSNVINGKHSRVSAATIEKVNSIIKEYNYVPNLSARSLTVKSSHIIGVIVPLDDKEDNGTSVSYFDNPYVSSMIGVIEKELRDNGYFVMIRAVRSQDDLSILMRNWNVDGAIFLYPRLGDRFEDSINAIVAETHLPVVLSTRERTIRRSSTSVPTTERAVTSRLAILLTADIKKLPSWQITKAILF